MKEKYSIFVSASNLVWTLPELKLSVHFVTSQRAELYIHCLKSGTAKEGKDGLFSLSGEFADKLETHSAFLLENVGKEKFAQYETFNQCQEMINYQNTQFYLCFRSMT